MQGTMKPDLPRQAETLRKRIERWRATRKRISPMPKELWAAAADLAKDHGVLRIARALRVDFGALKKRVKAAEERFAAGPDTAGFIELPPFATSRSGEAVLELTDDSGAKMICRVLGKPEVDVVGLANAFWRRNS